MQVTPTLFLYTKGFVFVWVGGESIWPAPKGNPCSFYFFSVDLGFFFWGGGVGWWVQEFGRGGWGKNIQTYLFKYCRGWAYLASASGEPLLKFFFWRGGWVGMSRNFSGMGGWKNIQTYFCLYMGRWWIYLASASGEPLLIFFFFFFFHVYFVF